MIQGTYPRSRSPNEQLAINEIPAATPAGLRPPRPLYASARARRHAHEAQIRLASLQHHKATAAPAATAPVEVAEAPEPKSAPLHLASAAPVHLASATTRHGHGGMYLITAAYAAESVKI